MKITRFFSAIVLVTAFIFAIVGCGNKTPTLSSVSKTSTIMMKASPMPVAMASNNGALKGVIPTPGGAIDLSAAMINLDQIRIEENSGFDGEHQGNNNDGDQGGADTELGGAEGPEAEQDIVLYGPFAFDISSGEAAIQSVDVYPGTFKKVDLAFAINTAPPFNGKTIVLSGAFTPTNGSATPIAIRSEFSKVVQLPIAGSGLIVTDNSTATITVAFDLASWFNNVDLSTAQISNGEILIDNAHNTALLDAIEANLAKYVDIED